MHSAEVRTVVKLIMTLDVRDGKESEFLEFVNNEFARSLAAMTIQPTEAWYAIWGEGPQAMLCGIAEDLSVMESAFASDEWRKIKEKVAGFAESFSYKVVDKTDGFQI